MRSRWLRSGRARRGALVLVGAVALAVAGFAGGRRVIDRSSSGATCAVSTTAALASTGVSPAAVTTRSRRRRHFEYVISDGEINVYDVDRGNRAVQRITLPKLVNPRGAAVNPATSTLYIACGGQGGDAGNGSLLALDLRRNRVVWRRDYKTGVDSIAITPNGRRIYMPVGEQSHSGLWEIVDAATGALTGSIEAGGGAHNTIISHDGRHVYLAGVDRPYLAVASTRTNRLIRWIGPLKSGGRPFTINGAQTLAFTTARNLLGFQVSSIRTGRVLYTVHVRGFRYDPRTFLRSPSHGISLSPDERQIYVIDTPNGYVHVFDVSRLCRARACRRRGGSSPVRVRPPRRLADIKLEHPPPNDGWLQHSRNGRYVYVGRAGDVIDTRTFEIVDYLPPLQRTSQSLEIDWRNGRVARTTTRYGVGYLVP